MWREVRGEDAALEAVVDQLVGSSIAPDSFVAEDLVREVRFLGDGF